MCSPKNLDLCDDEKKAQITKYQDMSDEDLAAAISSEEKKLDDAEAEFKAEVQKCWRHCSWSYPFQSL